MTVLTERPQRELGYPAIWPSKSYPGHYGVVYPGEKPALVRDLNEADQVFAEQIVPGMHIQAQSTNLPASIRHELMTRHNIDITPIILNGKEIAYVFHGRGKLQPTLMLSAHGNGMEQRTFTKPAGVEFQFATPNNTVMLSRTMAYAKLLRDNQITIQGEGQIYMQAPRKDATNYALDGNIGAQPHEVAQLVGEINRDGAAKPFDVVLLNRHASNVYFADLVAGLQQTLQGVPSTLVAHICRPKDQNATQFNVLNR